jgi:predicted N-acetyltransferase YhbS
VSIWSEPRALLQQEWPAFRTALNRVFRPDGTGDLTEELPLLFLSPEGRPALENSRIITGPGGVIAAHAGWTQREAMVLRRPVRVGFIGAVFTEPTWRGKGLGTRVLRDALDRARAGADLVLASGDRDLYRRQGFEPVPPLARYRLPAPAGSAAVAARVMTPDDIPAVAALYGREDVHFQRSPEDWTALLRAGRLVDAPATFSVVTRGAAPVAFVAAQNASTRADGSVRPRRILEIAGERESLLAAAPALADELLVPAYDSSTIGLATARGWFRTARQFAVTADPLTAVARLVPWYGLNYL